MGDLFQVLGGRSEKVFVTRVREGGGRTVGFPHSEAEPLGSDRADTSKAKRSSACQPLEPWVLAEGNRKSSTRSYLDYMFPTEYSDHLFPQSFEFKTLGRSLEVVVVRPADSTGTRLAIRLDHCQNPVPRSWPENAPDRSPKVFMPDGVT